MSADMGLHFFRIRPSLVYICPNQFFVAMIFFQSLVTYLSLSLSFSFFVLEHTKHTHYYKSTAVKGGLVGQKSEIFKWPLNQPHAKGVNWARGGGRGNRRGCRSALTIYSSQFYNNYLLEPELKNN